MVDVDKKADKVEEKVNKEVNKIVDKVVEREQGLKKEEKEQVKQEVKMRFGQEIIEKTKKASSEFRREFKRQTVTAITAAFAFLIALSWREPISEGVSSLILRAGLKESLIYYKFLSAVIITFLGVIFLIILSKWSSEKK